MPKVSVIVPVFNNEKYLARCLNSLIAQTLDDIEIVIINDGSTDSSMDIISDYFNMDNRIKVVEQKNQGVSAARNSGIDIATGKYVGFVDADDYVEKTMFYDLYSYIEKEDVDLISCNYYRVKENIKVSLNNKKESRMIEKLKEKDFFARYTWGDLTNVIDYSVWNSLYKKDIIQKYNIRFEKGIAIGEDYLFNMDYLKYINRIYYFKLPLYYYVENFSSTMNVLNEKFIENGKKSVNKLESKSIDKVAISLFTYRHFQYVLRHISLSDIPFKEKCKKIKAFIKDNYYSNKINKTGINKLNFEKKTIYILYKLKCSSLIILFINLVHKYYRLKEKK